MRRSFAVLAVAAMALAIMCGAAFADASAVAEKINSISGLTATANGSTVTVTGTASIEKDGNFVMYELGDLTGVTIDWKADLTVSLGANINDNGNFIFSGTNGTFNMLDGKIELVSTPDRKTREVWVFGGNNTTYVMSGGVVTADSEGDRGFYGASSFTLDGATVNFAKGGAITVTPKLIKKEISKVTGEVSIEDPDDPQKIGFEMFGKKTILIRDMEALQEAIHINCVINKGAEVTFSITDLSNAKTTLGCVVEGTINFAGIKGRLTSLRVKSGGVAVIADDTDFTIDEIIVEAGGQIAGEVSAAASYDPNSAYGILAVEGKLTIPAGKTLKLESIKGLINSGSLVVNGKIELPSGTTPEQMKELASDLGITGSVFEMNGKTYNDQGEETANGGGSSSGACNAGFGFAALAALAIAAIKRRAK